MHKVRTPHKHKNGKIFSWMVLILGLGVGITLPIFPNFVKSIILTDEAVSLFYAGMALIMLIGALVSTILFRKVQRTTITKISLFASGTVFILLSLASSLIELAILDTIKIWFNLFLIMVLSLFVRDFAEENELGEEEGLFYRYHNIGYFIGPIIGGVVANLLNYEAVFLLAGGIMIIGLIFFYHKHIIQKHPAIINIKKTTIPSLKNNIKKYFQSTARLKAYLITIVSMSWISFKRLYIPLFVIESGYIESISGIILALSIIPLIICEVKVGEYADKKGVRMPITVGFLIMAATLLIMFFSPYPIISLIIYVIGNIGGGFVEPLQEYYLFKNLPKEEEDNLYGVFRTSDPLAYFLAPAIGSITLLFLPLNYVFLTFGLLIFLASGLFFFTLQRS